MSTLTEPLTMNVGRRPGQKEERWANLLVDLPDMTASQVEEGPSPHRPAASRIER